MDDPPIVRRRSGDVPGGHPAGNGRRRAAGSPPGGSATRSSMAGHPDLEAEQAYIDHAYACLEASREAASRMTSMVEVGRGGTNQARYERDVIWDTMVHRLAQLDLGDAALCFGRIDLVVVAISPSAYGGLPSGGGRRSPAI